MNIHQVTCLCVLLFMLCLAVLFCTLMLPFVESITKVFYKENKPGARTLRVHYIFDQSLL